MDCRLIYELDVETKTFRLGRKPIDVELNLEIYRLAGFRNPVPVVEDGFFEADGDEQTNGDRAMWTKRSLHV